MTGFLFWLCVLFVFYVYAGYPLLLGMVARLRRAAPAYPTITPGVTLLIAAYNEEKVLAAKLENSLALDYPREQLQILVAADGSDDGTVDIVRSYAGRGVELSYDAARRGKMSAINRAVTAAKHEIVAFSDANNLYAGSTLREMVRPFADSGVGAVTGRKSTVKDSQRLGQADALYWRYESFIKGQENRLGCCVGVSGEVFAIRKELFTPPPPEIINDDFYMALDVIRKGFRVAYAEEAVSSEAASRDEADEITRRSRIVAGRFQIMALSLGMLPYRRPWIVWEIVSHKFLRPLVPPVTLFASLITVAALFGVGNSGGPRWVVLAFPFNWILFATQAAFYLLALVGGRRRVPGLLGKLLYLPAFLINSNLAALRGLGGYLTHRQTVVWKKALR